MARRLISLSGRKASGRRIVIRRYESIESYQPSQILFVGRSVSPQARTNILSKTHGSSTLVVGESAGFGVQGAGLNFFIDRDGTVGFETNVDAMNRRHLKVDAKMLSISRVVRDAEVPQS